MLSPLETRFQIAVLSDGQDRNTPLGDSDSFEWLVCRQAGERVFDFYKGDSLLSSIDLENPCFDLSCLVGLIVIGSAELAESIRNQWASSLPSIGVLFKQVPAWDAASLCGAALECMANDLASYRRQGGLASLELATFRGEFDRLQRCFALLEEYVGRHSLQRSIESFEYPPDADAAPENNRQAQSLFQLLPVDSLGLSSVAIYVSGKPEADADPLYIELRAIETDALLAEWLLGVAETKIGWVELALNHAIDEPALSLTLAIDIPAESREWAVALGPPHPYEEFCARGGDGESLGAPIALRLFSSLPGVRLAATTHAVRQVDAPHLLSVFVPYEVYGTVAQVSPPLGDNQQTLVFYDREIGCLTVHPRAGGLAAASLHVASPRGAWRLSAQIHLAHERASRTSFALMVGEPRNQARDLERLQQLDAPSAFFSGWKTLAPLETGSISIVLAAPPEQLAVYLVTRQAPDLSPDYAWARFSRFEFNILPESLIGRYGTPAPVAAAVTSPEQEDLIAPSRK